MYFKSVNTREKAEKRIKFIKQTDPFNHFLIKDIFEKDDIELLKEVPLEKQNRLIINGHFVYQNPQFTKLVRLLYDFDWWSKRIPTLIHQENFDCLRMELIEDFDYPNMDNVRNKMFINISDNSGFSRADDYRLNETSKEFNRMGRILEVDYKGYGNIRKEKTADNLTYVYYRNSRNRPKLFEPKKWDKLDLMERDVQYDKYIEWCGGLYEIDNRKESYVIPFDNVDILNPGNEDNLYKKLKAYILISRRWDSRGTGNDTGFDGDDPIWTEKRLRKEMDDFKKLILDNIDELILNLSGRWLFGGILLCFIENGTDEEKFISSCLLISMLINRVNFEASSSLAPRGIRDIWSQRNYMMEEEKEFLITKILPLTKKKDFESFVKEFIDVIIVGPEKLKRHQLFPTLALLWNKEETSKFKNLFLKTLNEKLSCQM